MTGGWREVLRLKQRGKPQIEYLPITSVHNGRVILGRLGLPVLLPFLNSQIKAILQVLGMKREMIEC